MATVTQALNNAFGQRQVSTIYNALNQYRVVMEVAPELAQGPEALDRMYVIANDGQRVPLSAFSGYEHGAADDRVSHWGQFASTGISFELKPGVSLSQAKASIDRAVARLAMPSTIQGRMEGNARLFETMQGSQSLAIIGTLLIVYIVLGVLYESYMHPLTILSTLPSAGVGALLALRMMDTEFSLIAMLGLFLLVGRRDEKRDPDDRRRSAARARARSDAVRGDPRSVSAPAASDPDDDDGGDAGRDAADDRQRWREPSCGSRWVSRSSAG